MAIYLKITEESNNQSVRLGPRPIFIGRSSKCHITLNDNMVSGKHLAIKINADEHVVIKDLNTTNGTYLNGNKIDESLLYLDDFIQLGRVKISLLPDEMTSQELKVHQRDFERTNVTFVKLGNQLTGEDDDLDGENGINKQRTLLAKIRQKNMQADPSLSSTAPESNLPPPKEEQPSIVFDKESSSPKRIKKEEDDIDLEVDELPGPIEEDTPAIKEKSVIKDSKSAKSTAIEDDDDDEYEYEYVDEDEDANGLVSKIKGLFKR